MTQNQSPERVVTIVGSILSIAAGVLLPVLAGDGDARFELILGIGGFLVGYLTTMDLATRARLRELEANVKQRIEEAETRRFGALPLQRLMSVPEIEEAIRDVVEAAAHARTKRMPFLANRTIEQIQNDRDETLRISQGVFRCADEQEQNKLVRLALQDTRTSVKAVAGLGLAHWREAAFRDYFDTYLDFSVTLAQQRFFLVEAADMAEQDMLDLLEQHRVAGVHTWALDKLKLNADQSQPMVVFDDQLLLSHTAKAGSSVDVHFTDDRYRLSQSVDRFDQLLRLAKRNRDGIVLWASP